MKAIKTRAEIRADLERILSEIVAESYFVADEYKMYDRINGIAFKTFLIDRADEIIKQQNFMNNVRD
jgi:hypothetical protein